MTLLSKSAILCANDLQTEDVDVPEWGGAVRVRSFTHPVHRHVRAKAKLGMNEQHRSPIAIKKWMAVCKHAHDEAGAFVHLLFILSHRQTL
jgi:hypothetical protein